MQQVPDLMLRLGLVWAAVAGWSAADAANLRVGRVACVIAGGLFLASAIGLYKRE